MLNVKLITYTTVVEALFFFGNVGSFTKTICQRIGDRFFLLLQHRNQAGSAEPYLTQIDNKIPFLGNKETSA